MKRKALGIIKRDWGFPSWIRKQTGILVTVRSRKWDWAGRITCMTDYWWIAKAADRETRNGKVRADSESGGEMKLIS